MQTTTYVHNVITKQQHAQRNTYINAAINNNTADIHNEQQAIARTTSQYILNDNYMIT